MKKGILLMAFTFALSVSFCQEASNLYTLYSKKADSLYNIENYTEAIKNYELAIKSNGSKGKVMHRYRYAASFCKLEKFELALDQIEIIITKSNFNEYEMLHQDKTFIKLFNNERWQKLMALLKEKSQK
jgi:tetratricopeptide (TPR) repeat protein